MSYVLNNDLCSKILYSCKCLSQLQFHNLNTTYTFKTANRYYTNAKKKRVLGHAHTLFWLCTYERQSSYQISNEQFVFDT